MRKLLLLAPLAGLLALGPAPASPPVQPAVFSNPLEITNPYHPLVPGAIKVYTGRSDGERVVILDLHLHDTRVFQVGGVDVPTRVLQETEFEGGELVEISSNFFAQADDGTVYYFGEVVDDYEDGQIVGHEGSWLVGGPTLPSDPPETANAAAPAVFMPGNPEVGDTFKPEDVFPIADETVRVLSLNRRVVVPVGRFQGAMEVEETSPLSTGRERKWYVPGLGVVKGLGKRELFQLVAVTF